MLTMLTTLYGWTRSFLTDEEGQGLAEYALILVLVSIAAVAALTTLGTTISGVFGTINSNLGGGS